MKPRINEESTKRWLELLEKHKDRVCIKDIKNVRNLIKRNSNSWGILMLKLDLICLEYAGEGE